MASPAATAASSSVQQATTATELIISASCERPRDYQSIEREPPQRAAPPEETVVVPVCKKYYQKGTCWEHVTYLFALSVASYAGVIARIYLAKLSQWDGVPLFPSLYAEMVGTAIMGFTISHKGVLEKNHSAVYQAIATGLCGSITTFSSWNSEATSVLIQANEYPPDNAQRMIGWITILLLGFGMPVASLHFGKHLAHLSPWCDRRLQGNLSENEDAQVTPRGWRCSAGHCGTAESILIVVLWVFSTVLVTFLPFYFNQFDLMFSCVFSFVGTYTRWHLAPLNAVFKDFKLGTFLVNVLGSWILGATLVLKKHFGSQLDQLGAAALTGVATGFCGCLTTVSTFAVELTSLSLRGTYIYGLCSVILAQLGLAIIRGVYLWTV